MKLHELHDEQGSLLVQLIQQRLAKGDEVLVHFTVDTLHKNFEKENIKFTHDGQLERIEEIATPDSMLKRNGEMSVSLHFRYLNKHFDDFRTKNVVLPAEGFDDLYHLVKRTNSMGDSHFVLTNVEITE